MYIFGIIIVVFGLAFLLRNLGFLNFDASFWAVFYPVVIMGLGAAIICVTHEGRKLLKKLKDLFKS
jgi:tellurite resistance protein TehA-like permease